MGFDVGAGTLASPRVQESENRRQKRSIDGREACDGLFTSMFKECYCPTGRDVETELEPPLPVWSGARPESWGPYFNVSDETVYVEQGPGAMRGVELGAVSPDSIQLYRVYNSTVLRLRSSGVAYRYTKNTSDKVRHEGPVPWGEIVQGIDEGDGWLRVGPYFLPMEYNGRPMITSLSSSCSLPECIPPSVRHASGAKMDAFSPSSSSFLSPVATLVRSMPSPMSALAKAANAATPQKFCQEQAVVDEAEEEEDEHIASSATAAAKAIERVGVTAPISERMEEAAEEAQQPQEDESEDESEGAQEAAEEAAAPCSSELRRSVRFTETVNEHGYHEKQVCELPLKRAQRGPKALDDGEDTSPSTCEPTTPAMSLTTPTAGMQGMVETPSSCGSGV